jgi:hypothetical protein
MRRREFVKLFCGTAAAVWPGTGNAQKSVKPIVGFLSLSSPGPHAPFVAAFNEGLRETGFIEGENLGIEYRWRAANSIDCPHWRPTSIVARSMSSPPLAVMFQYEPR